MNDSGGDFEVGEVVFGRVEAADHGDDEGVRV